MQLETPSREALLKEGLGHGPSPILLQHNNKGATGHDGSGTSSGNGGGGEEVDEELTRRIEDLNQLDLELCELLELLSIKHMQTCCLGPMIDMYYVVACCLKAFRQLQVRVSSSKQASKQATSKLLIGFSSHFEHC